METPNWRQIVASLFGIVALGLLGYFGQAKARVGTPTTPKKAETRSVQPISAPVSKPEPSVDPALTAESKIYVDVSGEVAKPGFYWLQSGARLNDLVSLSGGLTPLADRDRINMALLLNDGQKIVIPAVRATSPSSSTPPASPVVQSGGENAQFEDSSNGPKQPVEVNVVKINSASKVEFEGLPGIGPSLAERIIQYRDQVGGFRSVEELKQVRGVGEKLFEKIRDRVQL